MTDIVTLTNLTKTYNGIPALRDVTMSIPSGKIIGLLGPNGSVKHSHQDFEWPPPTNFWFSNH